MFQILKKQRQTGNDSFLCVKEVVKLLKEEGFDNNSYEIARRGLIKLSIFGVLEVKMSGDVFDWKRKYRIKKEYIE